MYKFRYVTLCVLVSALLTACVTTKKPDTGRTGMKATCDDGERTLLDCARMYEQYTRTIRFDIGIIRNKAVGFGIGAQQLMQLDSITADLMAHMREVCVQYNNCILSKEEYKKESAYLRRAQMKVREAASQFASYYPSGISGGGYTSSSGQPPQPPAHFQTLFSEVVQTIVRRADAQTVPTEAPAPITESLPEIPAETLPVSE